MVDTQPDPVLPDPVLPDPYDPQQLNRYAYVRNNPVKYVDPSGNFVVEFNVGGQGNLGLGGGIDFTASVDIPTPLDHDFGIELSLSPFVGGETGLGIKGEGGFSLLAEGNEVPEQFKNNVPYTLQGGFLGSLLVGLKLGLVTGEDKFGLSVEALGGPAAYLGAYGQSSVDAFTLLSIRSDNDGKFLKWVELLKKSKDIEQLEKNFENTKEFWKDFSQFRENGYKQHMDANQKNKK